MYPCVPLLPGSLHLIQFLPDHSTKSGLMLHALKPDPSQSMEDRIRIAEYVNSKECKEAAKKYAVAYNALLPTAPNAKADASNSNTNNSSNTTATSSNHRPGGYSFGAEVPSPAVESSLSGGAFGLNSSTGATGALLLQRTRTNPSLARETRIVKSRSMARAVVASGDFSCLLSILGEHHW